MFERKLLSKVRDHLEKKEISIIVGARQTGKTTILEQIYSFLLGSDKAAFLLTLEDPALLNSLNEHPDNIFKFLKTGSDKLYLLIDEIQYLENPSNFLKYLYDKHKVKIKIIATGSSAFYIDKKFTDSLAGRKKLFELTPLDFEEFLLFREQREIISEWQEMRHRSDFLPQNRKLIQSLFDEYITYGGYPAVVLEEGVDGKRDMLRELFHSYLKRDIQEAGVQNEDKFYNLITLLAHQSGSLLNINELSNTLRLSVTAVDNYIYILRKCLHISLVRPFYRNIRKELTKMPKIYFNDNGFRNVIINQFNPVQQRIDRGILIENYASIRLRQLHGADNLKYWRTSDGNEVDFVIEEIRCKGFAIEVKFDYKEFKPSKQRKFLDHYPELNLQCRAYLSDSNDQNILTL
jgi:uncharacterized protein